ncbi:hypothetical protein D3C86_2131490 [compost metagenome]
MLCELLALYFQQLVKLLTNQQQSPWYRQHILLRLKDREDMERGIYHEPSCLQDQIHLQHRQDQSSGQAPVGRQHHNDEQSQ